MATFKTRARALDMLGRQQIAGIPTAINELFKNAHDAYADNVELDYFRQEKIVMIRDDGFGMTKDDFLSRWLVLGTESKVDGDKNFKSTFLPEGHKYNLAYLKHCFPNGIPIIVKHNKTPANK